MALIQSLVRNGDVADIVADYDHLIVEECIYPQQALSLSLDGLRRDTWWVYRHRRTDGRASSHYLYAMAAPFATGLMQEFTLPKAAFAIRSR